MPIQKGKTRKRPRKRRSSTDEPRPPVTDAVASANDRQSRAARASSPLRRQRRELPPWANLAIGLVLLLLGGLFALTPQRGLTGGWNVAILVGYVVLAGYYLNKAFRQYRRQRNA